MIDYKEMERAGNAAVKRLRVNKLMNGHPFMINANDLPSSECYLEYPDGHISLATISSSKTDFQIIRDLTKQEMSVIRLRFNLPLVNA